MTVNRYRNGTFETVSHIDAGDGTEASVKVYRGDTDTWEEIWPVETVSLTQPVGDPIHWWPMSEGSGSTVRDQIASDNGTSNGATWTSGDWIGDAALEGDGSSAYVDTGSNAGLSGEFAIALTFVHPYSDGTVASDAYVASAGFDGTNTSWEMRFDSGNDALEILSWDGATHWTSVPVSDISANEPHRFVGQYDATAGEWQIYIDDTLESTTADATGAVTSSASRYFFAHDDNGITERYFSGTIDDVVLYDSPLTDQEIADDFARRPWTTNGGGDTFERPWTERTNANPYDDNLTYNYVGVQPDDFSFENTDYADRVTADEADITVSTVSGLYNAFGSVSQGETIWIEPGDYDISGQTRRQDLPADATLASDGARLYDETGMNGVLELTNDGARVTGLRLEGDQETGSNTEQTIAILARADVEIDNCEIYWWQTAGIYVGFPDSNNPFVQPRIRHCIIRDCRTDGLGYGVVTYYQTDPLIEYNYVNNCREGLASNGNDTASYRAENNLHGPDATIFAFECHEPGGVRMRIHDNEIQLVERNDGNMGRGYAQRGTPTDGADLQFNWFHNPNPPDPNDSTASGTAISQTNHAASPNWDNVTWSNNHYGDTEPSDSSIGIDELSYGEGGGGGGGGGGDLTGEDDRDSDGNPIPNADAPWGYYDHDVADENWTAAAADDFTGTLSDSNWDIGFGWGRSHGSTEEYCRDQDVWIDADTERLVLQTLPGDGNVPGDNTWYGGAANTLGVVEGTHGYWEASINMPEPIDSMIPGFWTRGADDLSGTTGWPPEVDFMERFGHSDGHTYTATVHYNSGDDEENTTYSASELLSSGFNVYGCHWTDSYCDFYFNGQHIGRTTSGHGTSDYRLESQIHYAILTMHVWITDWNGDDPDLTFDYPCFTEIDWFRFWHF